jgi:hypothetical protein
MDHVIVQWQVKAKCQVLASSTPLPPSWAFSFKQLEYSKLWIKVQINCGHGEQPTLTFGTLLAQFFKFLNFVVLNINPCETLVWRSVCGRCFYIRNYFLGIVKIKQKDPSHKGLAVDLQKPQWWYFHQQCCSLFWLIKVPSINSWRIVKTSHSCSVEVGSSLVALN